TCSVEGVSPRSTCSPLPSAARTPTPLQRSAWALGMSMHLYFPTTRANAYAILRAGFHNRARSQRQDADWTGVLLYDRPRSLPDGELHVLVSIDWADHDLEPYERHTGSTGYREFLIPAAMLNRYGGPHLYDRPDQT